MEQKTKTDSQVPPPNRIWFAINLMLFLLLASALQYISKSLVTPHASRGIVSFELSSEGQAILNDWSKMNVISTAYSHTFLDFLFIISYSLLVWHLFRFTYPRTGDKFKWIQRWWLPVAKWLVIVAGIMDVIENLAILYSLKTSHYAAVFIHLPSMIKFILLGISLVAILLSALRWLSGEAESFLKGIVIFRFVIISLLLLFFILWMSDQGQDLLLSLNSHWLGPLLSLLGITILACCIWFLPKYYTENDPDKITVRTFFTGQWNYEDKNDVRKVKKFTGRLLGAAGLIVPGVSILHAMQTFHIPYLLDFIDPFLLLFILIIAYRMVLQEKWFCNWNVVAVVATVTFSVIWVSSLVAKTPSSFLAWFAVDCLLLSLVFLLYTNVRTTRTRFSGIHITPYIIISALLVTLFFFLSNIDPLNFAFAHHYRFITLPIVLAGITFYLFVLSVLRITGKKYEVHFITLILLVMFTLVNVIPNNFHRIRTFDDHNSTAQPKPLISLDSYTEKWLDRRKDEINLYKTYYHKPYPVFLVNAYGGGIRAAAWTGKYIHHLDTLVYRNRLYQNSPAKSTIYDFQHHIFSYSGASGGTMGAAVLCAQRFAQLGRDTISPKTDSSFFSNDFLTPVIIPLLGRDIWFAFLGSAKIRDRARIQEQTWEHHAKQSNPSFQLNLRMSDYWTDTARRGEIPLLFSNSYYLDSGLKAIVAPVHLDQNDFPATFLVNNRIGDTAFKGARELRLSTAALMSARFPFISPAGELDDFHHFMDGGLKENSGAETSADIHAVFQRVMDKMNLDSTDVQIIILSVNNTMYHDIDSLPLAKNVFELGAPLTALMNNWVGNTRKADRINQEHELSGHYKYFFVQPAIDGGADKKFRPVFPLGWQISDESLKLMDSCLSDKRVNDVSQKILKIITAAEP